MGRKISKKERMGDKYYQLAKSQGYRARSAYKLIQLNKKHDFLSNAKTCLDLCAAPGGWMQVAAKHMPVAARIVGVDLMPIKAIGNCVSLVEDITTAKCRSEIKKVLKGWKVNVVLHDGAPNVGSNWVQDAYTQNELVLHSLKLATEFLSPNGTFVTKVFRSQDYNTLLWVFGQLFYNVHATKPQASRNTSAEIFVVCLGYKNPDKIDPKLLDPRHVFKELQVEKEKVDIFAPIKKKQRPNRLGYEDDTMLLFKKCEASEFVDSETPVELLANYNEFTFNDQQSKIYLKHPDTNSDVVENCKDLKILGKKDFKRLINWRLSMQILKKELNGEVSESEEEVEVEMTEEEKERLTTEELEKTILEMEMKKKRKKRKANLKKSKYQRRVDMQMDFPNDQFDLPDEIELFKLNELEKGKQLDAVLNDTKPDTLYDSSDEEMEEELSDEDEDYENKLNTYMQSLYDDYTSRASKRTKRIRIGKKEKKTFEDDEINSGLFDESQKTELSNFKPKISSNPCDTDSENESESGNVSESNSEYDSESEDESDKESNPLIVKEEEDSNLASKRALLWFDQKIFEDIENDNEEEIEIEIEKEPEKKIKKKQSETTKKIEKEEEKNEKTEKQEEQQIKPKISLLLNPKKRKLAEIEAKNEEKSKKRKVNEIEDMVERDSESEKEESDFETVPLSDSDDSSSMDEDDFAETLALADIMAKKRSHQKDKMMDDAYNKHAFDDDDLPQWFAQEESKFTKAHSQPITKQMVLEMKDRLKEINARPTKKIAEAKGRKKMKLLKKLERANQQAQAVADSNEIGAKEKTKSIEKLYSKAKSRQEKKKVYVVTKGGSSTSIGKTKGQRIKATTDLFTILNIDTESGKKLALK